MPGTIGEILSVPLIRAAHLRYPKIKLRIAEAMSGFVLEWMRDARVDLAVLYREVSDHGIVTARLLQEELKFFGPAESDAVLPPPGGLVSLAAIQHLPLILPGASHGLRELLARYGMVAGVDLTTVIDVDSYANIKELVRTGLGYSILPENAICREVAAGCLRSWVIGEPPFLRSVYLAHSVDRPMTNAVAAIHLLARETLVDLARTGKWAGSSIMADDNCPDVEP